MNGGEEQAKGFGKGANFSGELVSGLVLESGEILFEEGDGTNQFEGAGDVADGISKADEISRTRRSRGRRLAVEVPLDGFEEGA